jgi:hypothetical protein
MKRYVGPLALTFVAVAAVCAFAQKNPAPKGPHPAAQKTATVKIWGIVRDRATTQVLAGVQIGISGSACGTGSVTTDQSGTYTMNCTTNNTGSQQQGVTLTPRQTGLDFSPKTAYMSLANDARRDFSGFPAQPAQKSGKK